MYSQYLKSICLLCILYQIGCALVLLSKLDHFHGSYVTPIEHRGTAIQEYIFRQRSGTTLSIVYIFPARSSNMSKPNLLNISNYYSPTCLGKQRTTMTKGVQYTSPPGFGQGNLRDYKYNQVARVNDVLHIAGQGTNSLYWDTANQQLTR